MACELRHVEARAHGIRLNSTTTISCDTFRCPASRSLAEQQKIADCLTSLDELIAAQGRKLEALKTHKKGLMQQLFPREGETLPRLRFPEFRDAAGVGGQRPWVRSCEPPSRGSELPSTAQILAFRNRSQIAAMGICQG